METIADGAEEHPRTEEIWLPEREKEGDVGKVLRRNCDRLAGESLWVGLRALVGSGTLLSSLSCHLFLCVLLLFFNRAHGKQVWWTAGLSGQVRNGRD